MSDEFLRESRRSADACMVYLELGAERSVPACREALRDRWRRIPALNTVKRWSAEFGWVARAAAYDRELANRERERRLHDELDAREAARKRRLDTAHALRGLGARAVRALNARDDEDLDLTPRDIRDFFKHADDTERLELGEVTERTEVIDTMRAEVERYRAAVIAATQELPPDARESFIAALRRERDQLDAGRAGPQGGTGGGAS